MYLRRLELENVKLLADGPMSFERDGKPRLWTVLLGDNGVCKTTMLQAIALAASGDKLARALVRDAADYVRADAPQQGARIRAGFADAASSQQYDVELVVQSGRHDFDGLGDSAAQVNDLRGRRAGGFFVVAYGVGRYLPRPGEVAIPTDPVLDRVEGIFDTRHKMQFIVTTHSPLVLTGFDADEIIELAVEEGRVVRRTNEIEPAAQSASQLLTRYFDVPVAARPEIAQKEARYLA